MVLPLGFWGALRGTTYRSFQIGRNGATIFVGATAPLTATRGDLFIRTGSSPSIQQYINNAWVSISGGEAGDVTEQIENAINAALEEGGSIDDAIHDALSSTGYTTFDDVSEMLSESNFATISDISNAVSGLVTTDDLSDAISSLDFATQGDIDTSISELDFATPLDISNAIAGLDFATQTDIDDAIGSLTFASQSDIDNAVTDLVSTTDLTSAINGLNFATASDISNAIADLDYATEADITSAISALDYATDADISNAIEALDYVTPAELNTGLQNAVAEASSKVSRVFHVVAGTTISLPTGTIEKPFATIQDAHDHIISLGGSAPALINVAAGVYTGATLTRQGIVVKGSSVGNQLATRITSPITIQTNNASTNPANGTISLSDLFLNTGNTTAYEGVIIRKGTGAITISIENVKALSTGAGVNAHPIMLIDSDSLTRILVSDCNWNNISGHISTIIARNLATSSTIAKSNIYSGNAKTLLIGDSTIWIDTSLIGAYSVGVAEMINTKFTSYNSIFFSTGANSDGLDFDETSEAYLNNVNFNIGAGTGFAIKGVSGTVLKHANLTFDNNNKVSVAIGDGITALHTTFVEE